MAEKVSPEEAALLGLSAKQKVDPKEAEALGLPLRQGKAAQLGAIIKSNRANAGKALTTDAYDNLTDLPGMARSAAMGFTSNAASIPEEVYKTIVEPDGQNPGWHTEHPEVHEKYMKDVADHPVANIGGAMLQPNPLGKLKAASLAGKLALAGGRVAQASGQGALAQYMGQGDGPRASDSGDVGKATLLSGGVQAGMEAVSPVLGGISGKLRNAAGIQAANAAGLRGGIANQAKRAGIPILDKAGEESIPALGNQMLDEGLIPFGGSKLGVLRRSEKMMDQAGTAQAALLAQGDMVRGFDSAAGAKAAESRLASKIDPAAGGNLQTARAAGRARDFITDAQQTPGTFAAANDLKKGAYGSVNWSTEAPDAAKLKRTAVSGWRQSIEDQLDSAVPGAGQSLRKVNDRYGIAAKTADFAEEAAGREAANQKFGMGSLLLGATGAGAGAQFGPGMAVAGAGLPLVSHVLKTRGASMAAPLSRLGSQATGALGNIVNKSPAASGAVGSLLEQYLNQPRKDDEDREREAAEHFKSGG